MQKRDCVNFLQWALPQMRFRWPGFRKVRKQVCKRVRRRVDELGLGTLDDYRAYLNENAGEWSVLEILCRVTISRFYRDRGVFERLANTVLPELAGRAQREGDRPVRALSAGCAGGEEAYTLRILWDCRVTPDFPDAGLEIVAVDSDPAMLARARSARYGPGSLRELPVPLLDAAFERTGEEYQVCPQFRKGIEFVEADVRYDLPPGPFDLVLCRNLAFTYFADDLQEETLAGLSPIPVPGGYLVLGSHERLPGEAPGFEQVGALPISGTVVPSRRLTDGGGNHEESGRGCCTPGMGVRALLRAGNLVPRRGRRGPPCRLW